MIHDFVYGKFGSERAQRIVPCVKRSLTEARKNGMPVIFLKDAHRKGDKELEVWGEHAMKGTKGSEIIPEIAPQNGDYVLEKTRYCSYHETGLDELLKKLGVKEVILAGVATDICVRHTAADTFFRGFTVTVPSDCVETVSDEVQCRTLDEMKRLYNAKVEKSSKVIT
jgi:nicotinamidase-related amidase